MAKTSVGKLAKRFLLSFRSHWGLKLISLFFAILLWNYVIAAVNPTRTATYNNISMDTPSLAKLESANLTIKGGIASYMKNVSVSVDLPRSEVKLLKPEDIHVSINLAGITKEGRQDVKVVLTEALPRGILKRISPDTITVTVEKLEKRAVPIVCELTGTLPAGYWMDTPVITPQALQISGAVSDVGKVAKAVVQVSRDGLTNHFNSACDFVLIDKDGGTVSRESLNPDPPSCIVSFHVLPTKRVKIDPSHCLNGSPAKGYQTSGATELSFDTIEIASSAEILAKIDSLPLGRVDISGAKSDVYATASVQLPSDVFAVAGNSVTAYVKIVPKMVTRTMSGLPIEFTGLSGVMPEKSYYGSVTFTCPELSVSALDASNMHLKADASGMGAGAQTLTVTAAYDDAEAGVTGIVVDSSQIAVKLVSAP